MSDMKVLVSTNILPVEIRDIPSIMKGDKGERGRDGSYIQKAYKTYASMVTDKDSIPANSNVVVNNDPDKDKNAYYTYDGTEFTKSDFDPQGILTTVDVRLNQAIESASEYFQSQVADTVATAIDSSTVAYTDAIEVTKGEWANTISATNAAIIANSEAYLATIPGTVNDAINNTAVEGGVLADTFVTVTTNGVGTVARTQRDKNADYISAADFGVRPNTGEDVREGLQAAIDYCTSKGKTLFIPTGIYLSNGTLNVKCDIQGEKGTFLKDISGGKTLGHFTWLLLVQNVSNISIKDITVDGGIYDEDGDWEHNNKQTGWGGSFGIYITNSSYIKVEDVNVQNCHIVGIRIDGASKFCQVVRCHAKRIRGEAADGFEVVAKSSGISLIDCTAYDFTRIGFVVESGATNVSYINCHAEYAHHKSKDYGGGEFNAGFWFERASDVICVNCTALNIGGSGYVVATGNNNSNSEYAQFRFYDCSASQCDSGFSINDMLGVPYNCVIDGCSVTQLNDVFSGFAYRMAGRSAAENADGLDGGGNIGVIMNSYAEISHKQGFGKIGFLIINGSSTPNPNKYTIKDCILHRTEFDELVVYTSSNHSYDIGAQYISSMGLYLAMDVIIDNVVATDGNPVIFYGGGTNETQSNYTLKNMKNLSVSGLRAKSLKVLNSHIKDVFLLHTVGSIYIDGSTFELANTQNHPWKMAMNMGVMSSTSSRSCVVKNSSFLLNDCVIKTPIVSNKFATLFDNCVFKKDMDALDTSVVEAFPLFLRIQDDVAKSITTIKDCYFEDTGANKNSVKDATIAKTIRSGSLVSLFGDNKMSPTIRSVLQDPNNFYYTNLTDYLFINNLSFISSDTLSRTLQPLKIGTTANRPEIDPTLAGALYIGFEYFDTTLSKPIYWTGTKWVGADGLDADEVEVP